jgi:hypothetical protein
MVLARRLRAEAAPTLARREMGRVLPMEKQSYTRVPNAVYDDPTLTIYDRAVYGLLLRKDWNGAGWRASHQQIAAEAGCCVSKVQRSLSALQARGWVRWEGPDRHPYTYFAAYRPGDSSVPHTDQSPNGAVPDTEQGTETAIRSVPHTAQFGTTYRTEAVCSVPHTDNKEERLLNDKNDSVGAGAPSTAAQNQGPDAATARQAEAEKRRQALAEGRLARRPQWVQTFCRRAATSLGWAEVQPTTLDGWAAIVERQLADCTPAERDRFGHWLFSNGFFQAGHGFQLGSALPKEIDTWKSAGKPQEKATGKTDKSPPKVSVSALMDSPQMRLWRQQEAEIEAATAQRAVEQAQSGGVP